MGHASKNENLCPIVRVLTRIPLSAFVYFHCRFRIVSVLKMQKSIFLFIVSLLTVVDVTHSDSVGNPCPNIVNKFYQTTNQMSNEPDPWYGFLLFLPNGIVLEANNIAGGNSANSVGVNLTLGVHFGYYKCLPNKVVHLSDTGYMYTTPGVSFLSNNGAIPVHDYYLKFSGENAEQCTGSVRFVVFPTGSNPFDPSNTPVFTSANGTALCQFMDGRNFQFPT